MSRAHGELIIRHIQTGFSLTTYGLSDMYRVQVWKDDENKTILLTLEEAQQLYDHLGTWLGMDKPLFAVTGNTLDVITSFGSLSLNIEQAKHLEKMIHDWLDHMAWLDSLMAIKDDMEQSQSLQNMGWLLDEKVADKASLYLYNNGELPISGLIDAQLLGLPVIDIVVGLNNCYLVYKPEL